VKIGKLLNIVNVNLTVLSFSKGFLPISITFGGGAAQAE